VHALTEVFVRQTDRDTGEHTWERVDGRFDLCRIDVRAAADDEVGAAIRDVQVALGIDAAEIAEGFPFAARLGLRTEVVVGRAQAAGWPEIDLADLARRHIVARFVENPHARARRQPADRAAMLEPVATADDRRADRLGTGVDLPHAIRPQPFDPLLLEPRRARSRNVTDEL